MDVLDKIDKLRRERGWSINNLAMEAMLTQSTLNNLYSRHSEPKLSTLRTICQAFGITLSQLFAENVRTLLPDVCIEKGLPFCGSTDMGDLSYLIPVIQPTMSGFSGGLHSKDFRVIDPYLAYVAPAKVLASTVIDLLTNGAASAKKILQNTVRHSVSEYKALWHSILTSPTDEEIPL